MGAGPPGALPCSVDSTDGKAGTVCRPPLPTHKRQLLGSMDRTQEVAASEERVGVSTVYPRPLVSCSQLWLCPRTRASYPTVPEEIQSKGCLPACFLASLTPPLPCLIPRLQAPTPFGLKSSGCVNISHRCGSRLPLTQPEASQGKGPCLSPWMRTSLC